MPFFLFVAILMLLLLFQLLLIFLISNTLALRYAHYHKKIACSKCASKCLISWIHRALKIIFSGRRTEEEAGARDVKEEAVHFVDTDEANKQ